MFYNDENSEEGIRLPDIAYKKYTGRGLSTNLSKETIAEFNLTPQEGTRGLNMHKIDHIIQNKMQVAPIYREYK